jgi:hypothetical protein
MTMTERTSCLPGSVKVLSWKYRSEEEAAMAKETKITFSKEHTSTSHPEPHVDVYREHSDSAKTEKIDHNEVQPGYGNTAVEIPVKTEK